MSPESESETHECKKQQFKKIRYWSSLKQSSLGPNARSQTEKVLHQFLPSVRQHAFGMELNAFQWEFLVAEAHDHAGAVTFDGVRADLEIGWQAFFVDDQRVVACGSHGRVDAAEDGFAVVLDAAGFPVHQVFGADDLAAEGFAHCLVSQANTEYRSLAGELPDEVDADAGLVRGAGAGGDHDVVGFQGLDFVDGDLIVAADLDLRAEFSQVLHQVVGERVVVVEDEDHGFVP